jgi:hypothetical protein
MGGQGPGRAGARDRRRAGVIGGPDPVGIGIDEACALFDEKFYRRLASLPPDTDAYAHYLSEGAARGLKPNVVFEPAWYVARNPDAGSDPLSHYALVGEPGDRDPSPLFDVAWYRRTYKTERPLRHYLEHRFGPFSPIPEFDAAYYLTTYRDVGAAALDPFQHYLLMGYGEFRLPFEGFAPRLYALRRMGEARGENPVVHMRAEGAGPVFLGPHSGGPHAAARTFTRAGPGFEPPAPRLDGRPTALALAFHLPQFHRVPENDAWWGAGFTEWTALARGQPRFEGHYQPRIPGELGFYDLSNPAALRAQAELARQAGIGAFVFYHYDFGGRRLLQAPVDLLLATPDIDIGFCLMWANENWTRRWDGAEEEVLVAQDYAPAHEGQRLADFARHFRDPRYLRLEGRPLLMVYRASLIPETAATMARWRRLFDERHGENPILVMAQTFDDVDPRPLGFDVAIEFPPHKLTRGLPQVFDALDVFDEGLEADVYAYDDVVAMSLAEPATDFPLIKTAVPSWDNDARRQGKGLTLVGATPHKFGRWLGELIARAAPVFGAKIVAVNAWNEWSEGAYLEPDVYYGSACLNAAQRAIFARGPEPLSFAFTGEHGQAARRLAEAFGLRPVAFASAQHAASSGLANLTNLIEPTKGVDTVTDAGARALFAKLFPAMAKVSAFLHIPTGAAFSRHRLACVFAQTHPLWEIVVLDESGSEDLLPEVEAAADDAGRDLTMIFDPPLGARTPWARVAEAATGEFVWLLTPRGASDSTFVQSLAAPMQADARLALAFCNSGLVDGGGRRLHHRPSPLASRTQGVVDRVHVGDLKAAPVRPDAAVWRLEALKAALKRLGEAPALDALVRDIAAQPQSRILHLADTLDGVPQPHAV